MEFLNKHAVAIAIENLSLAWPYLDFIAMLTISDPFRCCLCNPFQSWLVVSSLLHRPRNADWGNGCFWHVQHEMIKAEQDILGR